MFRKFNFYLKNYLNTLLPLNYWQLDAKHILSELPCEQRKYIQERVKYSLGEMNNFNMPCTPEVENLGHGVRYLSCQLNDIDKRKRSAYYFDLFNALKLMPKGMRVNTYFGDINTEETLRTIVKARPIKANNRSTLLKLNALRHYQFFEDKLAFIDKKPQAVFRGACHTPARQNLVKKYFSHSQMNVCNSSKSAKGTCYFRDRLTVGEQLEYRYIISIEGKDVATNLKWILNSNSLCLMPKPTCESWLLEGKLVNGVHYIEIANDFSDIPEKISYYNHHPEEAQTIIQNAQQYLKPFKDPKLEQFISYLVLEQYLKLSGQIAHTSLALDVKY